MHATQLLDTYLFTMCQGIHKKRWGALMATINALIQRGNFSVTRLGRAIKSEAYEKYNIKRADRLIGNPTLNQERPIIYRAMISLLIRQYHSAVIVNAPSAKPGDFGWRN